MLHVKVIWVCRIQVFCFVDILTDYSQTSRADYYTE